MRNSALLSLLFSFFLPSFCYSKSSNAATQLLKFIQSPKPLRIIRDNRWNAIKNNHKLPVYISPQEGQMEADKVEKLPGQPEDVQFDEYAGYVTVDPVKGRALFYYFVEAPRDRSSKPLILWLNGGPGCSSLGYDAMQELGPFRVNSDGKTLYVNEGVWNNEMGNAYVDADSLLYTIYNYLWTHALIADETYNNIQSNYNFSLSFNATACNEAIDEAVNEVGNIDRYDIYAPICSGSSSNIKPSVQPNPCAYDYVKTYLNLPDVHLSYPWIACSIIKRWNDSPDTLLPTIQELINSGLRVWFYSGDQDSIVPVTSTRYLIEILKLSVESQWKAWYTNDQVGGYVIGRKGLTLATVRGAGHFVPSYQPERALTMFSAFLKGGF